MTKAQETQTQIQTQIQTKALSRRSFLISIGGASVAVAFVALSPKAIGAPKVIGANFASMADDGFRPNVWVTIAADDVVTIISPASEMGQGVMTSMPLLIAEDMDADWSKVRVIQAPADAKNYGNPGFRGAQLTGGSRTTSGYYEKLRLVGAQTRLIILACAADILSVPVAELVTELGVVLHKKSGRSLSYGSIAKDAKLPNPLPQVSKADLKPAESWRYIGKSDIPRIDVPSKVDGSAQFGIDVQLPDMLFAAVLRAPVQGEKPQIIESVAAMGVKGVQKIVKLPYGVGIIGETVEATKAAKELLDVTWSNTSKVKDYNSDKVLKGYVEVGRDLAQASAIAHEEGDVPSAIAAAAKVIAVDYKSDHVYHATMEPMNATALIKDGIVEIWAPTQSPTGTQAVAAQLTGVSLDKVKVNTMLLGGGLGRKAEADFITDAVLLAKEMPGRPVKVIWSREDDVQHGKYRPLESQHVQVGLDAKGDIIGWRHRVVAESIYARTFPPLLEKSGGIDGPVIEGTEFNYAVPAHLIEYIRQERGPDVGFWRAVGAGYTKFAVECVIDEIAAVKAVDPLAYRLELLKDEPRALNVIQAVAEMADWKRKRNGRALGVAYSDAWGHCAQIAEISLDLENGEIHVHNIWCAVDPGVAVQPLNIEAQIVGGIVHGASHALYEQINFIGGEVQESNFGSYRVMRMSETPDVKVTVISTPENLPAGVGEAGLPPTAPAIANAFAALTGGKRLRHLPFLPDRVLEALKA